MARGTRSPGGLPLDDIGTSTSVEPDILPSSSLARRTGYKINLEIALYVLFVLVAVFTRFYDLGGRPLHHDESLHAFFSWRYYAGYGYVHDPMMHGPFQFHFIALIYFLLGASDFTARIASALFGVAMVALPLLLRRHLGRWGALTASFLFLVSPGFLYFSRFARNDVFVAVWTMIIVISAVRYAQEHRPLWVYTGAAAASLFFATKETVYITTFLFLTFFALALAFHVSRKIFAGLVAYIVVAGGGFIVLAKASPLPAFPKGSVTVGQVRELALAFLLHPAILALAVVTLIFLAFVSLTLSRGWRDGEWLRSPSRFLQRFTHAPVPSSLGALIEDRRTLGFGVVVLLLIFVVLYTSFFTNLGGLATGAFGAIVYWLQQQDVKRGNQPWFYYLFLIPTYEPLSALFGTIGVFYYPILKLVRWWRSRGGTGLVHGISQRSLLFTFFLVYWAVGSLVVYSWAGEKMPWLMIEVSQPLILLTALMLGQIIEALERSLRSAGAAAGSISQRAKTGIFSRFRLGRGGRYAVLVLTGIFMLYQIHSAFDLAYYNGATPVEMAVYVQTSPDVERAMTEIDALSAELTGGKDMKVMYDSETSWPFEWYLRDYHNRIYQPSGPTSPPGEDVPVVLVGLDNSAAAERNLQDYERQPYVLRWWYPEELYRAFIRDDTKAEPPKDYAGWQPMAIFEDKLTSGISSFEQHVVKQISAGFGTISTLRDPQERAKLWRYILYREPAAPLGSTDFVVYVRKDIVKQYRSIWDQ